MYATRLAQPMHTDSADVVGLLCLRSGRAGGLSSWASSVSVHNELLRRGRRVRHSWRPAPVGMPMARLARACLAVQARLRHVHRSVRYLLSQRRRHGWTPGPRPRSLGFQRGLAACGLSRARARRTWSSPWRPTSGTSTARCRRAARPPALYLATPGACRSETRLPGTWPALKQATGQPRGTGGAG